jgi:hypothetical protein
MFKKPSTDYAQGDALLKDCSVHTVTGGAIFNQVNLILFSKGKARSNDNWQSIARESIA